MKASKADAHYQYKPQPNGDHCAICSMFRAPDHCTAVEGVIHRNGWCRYFEKAKK